MTSAWTTHAFVSRAEARGGIEAWRIDDDPAGFHAGLGGLSPSMFAAAKPHKDQSPA